MEKAAKTLGVVGRRVADPKRTPAMIFKRLAQALALLAAMPHGSLHATPVFDDAVPAWAKSRPLKLDPAKLK